MSIKAIEEIERFIHQRENGIPVSEIKRKIAEFVYKRDIDEEYNLKRRGGKRHWCEDPDRIKYSVRNGEILYREKL